MNRLAKVSTKAPSLLSLLIALTLATACVPVGGPAVPAVNVSVQPHRSLPHPCENRFAAHTLDHITSIEGEVVRTYDSNGSGEWDPLNRTGHVIVGSPGMHFTSRTFKL